jgi:sigma-E factor negative regulatory protein RseB
MKRKWLSCAALALAGSLAPAPAGWTQPVQPVADEAKQWLERMVEATQTLNYEGTFIYIQGPHVEAMRIIHGHGSEGERQRLFSLNGPPREVVVANNNVVCLLPKHQATFAGNDYPRSPFPLSIPREIGRLESHYQFEIVGADRIAGLEARIIAIKPRDAWRFGYRLWLDERNGLMLRSALLDDRGHPLEQLMFTDLQVKPQIDEAAFQSRALPEDLSPANPNPPAAPPPVGERVKESAWRVEQLPEGFVKVLHNRFAESASRRPTEHLVFADGLATISVFLEKLGDAPALLQGASRVGSMNAFGKAVNGYQVLVVGEVPAVTVQQIAAAIQYDPAQLKATPP